MLVIVDVELLGEGRMIGSENSVVTDVDIFTVVVILMLEEISCLVL